MCLITEHAHLKQRVERLEAELEGYKQANPLIPDSYVGPSQESCEG